MGQPQLGIGDRAPQDENRGPDARRGVLGRLAAQFQSRLAECFARGARGDRRRAGWGVSRNEGHLSGKTHVICNDHTSIEGASQ
jgi:hypothetical protein